MSKVRDFFLETRFRLVDVLDLINLSFCFVQINDSSNLDPGGKEYLPRDISVQRLRFKNTPSYPRILPPMSSMPDSGQMNRPHIVDGMQCSSGKLITRSLE